MHHQHGVVARRVAFIASLAAILVAAAFATGCTAPAEKPAASAPESTATPAAYPVTVTDDASRSVTVNARPERIVSLAPANTEILFAIGAGDRVVGVTTYDDYPPEVASIDKMGDFTTPNYERIAAAKPDLVLVTSGVQADVIKKLEELGATVVAIDPATIEATYADIAEIGQLTGDVDGANKVVETMRARIASIEKAVSGSPKVTAFVEIGQNPLYTVGSGTLIDELITKAGGTNVVTAGGYVPYSIEQLVKSNPQVYMATKGSSNDPSAIEKRAGFKGISAIKDGRIVILDDSLVSRSAPRLVDGLEQIARGLHPEAFSK